MKISLGKINKYAKYCKYMKRRGSCGFFNGKSITFVAEFDNWWNPKGPEIRQEMFKKKLIFYNWNKTMIRLKE